MSETERSNVMSKVCDRRSCSVISQPSTVTSRKRLTFRCLIITAFGVPVLPDVKMRYAIASSSGSVGANAGSNVTSGAPRTVCWGHRARSALTSSCSGEHDQERDVDTCQHLVELERRSAVDDERSHVRSLEHRARPVRRERAVQGDVAVTAEQSCQHAGIGGGGSIGEDGRERGSAVGSRALERSRQARGALVQRTVRQHIVLDLERGTIAECLEPTREIPSQALPPGRTLSFDGHRAGLGADDHPPVRSLRA